MLTVFPWRICRAGDGYLEYAGRTMKREDLVQVRNTLWKAADELRANSSMAPNEYRGPVLGLIFLAYAEHRFEAARPALEAKATARRKVTAEDYRAKSVLFIPDEARLSHLVNMPEGADLGKAADAAMMAVEIYNPELKDVLPKGYQRLENRRWLNCFASSRRYRPNFRATRFV